MVDQDAQQRCVLQELTVELGAVRTSLAAAPRAFRVAVVDPAVAVHWEPTVGTGAEPINLAAESKL